MDKNTIFSKLNIKDYNNELENILERKFFSLEVKNLLLSMLYKIENAFEDYKTVKVNVPSKKEFIENILSIIKQNCKEIIVVKPILEDDITSAHKEKSEEQLLLEKNEANYIINKEEGKIICYQNEISLLSAIMYIGEDVQESFPVYDYCQEAIKKMFSIGSNMSAVEVIRDFNGWSWDIVTKQMDSISYNFVYEHMLLLGNDILDKKEENALKFKKLFEQLSLMLYINNNQDKYDELVNIYEEKRKLLDLFENKKELVEKMTNDKKEYIKQIEQIDIIMNDKELLRKEYQSRNENLPNKEKIFSISHLADRLEKERNDLLDNISKCNDIIIPKKFVKIKQKLVEEIDFIEGLQLKNTDREKVLERKKEEYSITFLYCLEKKIDKTSNEEEIVKMFYKIRYFNYIPYNADCYLKEIQVIQKYVKQVIKKLIEKACKLKVIEAFSEQKELIYDVLREVFYTKMINIKNIVISCRYEKPNLNIEYYDTNILENTINLTKEDVRIKKKFKLFIV